MGYFIFYLMILPFFSLKFILYSTLGSTWDLLSLSMMWLVAMGVILSILGSMSLGSILWKFMALALMASFKFLSLFLFYIAFEFSLVPILLMILFWGNQPERLSAGVYLLLYTSFFSVPYIVMILYFFSNQLFFMENFFFLSFSMSMVLVLPFFVKMPVLGLHFWLPKAHVEASTSGSMILAGLLLKLGGYGVFRLFFLFKMKLFNSLCGIWFFLSVLSSFLTFMQADLKKLVAYSSVTHMTFLLVGLTSFSKIALFITILISLTHGWVSMSMFFSAGSLSSSFLSRLGFLVSSDSKFYIFSMLLGVMLMMNASIPPFPSFYPEVLVLSSILTLTCFSFLFIFLSLLVCYYNTYLFMWVNHFSTKEKGNFSLLLSEISTLMFSFFLAFSSLILLSFF